MVASYVGPFQFVADVYIRCCDRSACKLVGRGHKYCRNNGLEYVFAALIVIHSSVFRTLFIEKHLGRAFIYPAKTAYMKEK